MVLQESKRTFANGTFKSTRTNTFFPSKSTLSARPVTFNFAQQIVDVWNDRRDATDIVVAHLENSFVGIEEKETILHSQKSEMRILKIKK